MTAYARIDPVSNEVTVIELSAEQYAAFAGNPKQQWLRPLVVDPLPVPSPTQQVVRAGYVIELTQVRQTWSLRDLTAAELNGVAQEAERAVLKTLRNVLEADVAAGVTAPPTTAAQAFVEIQDLKRRALRTDRVLLWLIKQP
jgi:hypothetical protein